MAKLQDIVNIATKGSVGGFWDAISGKAALRDLRRQYATSLSFVDPKVGIPDQIKDNYDAALKRNASRLWQGILKVGASGFGKGALIAAGIILLGGALLFGAGAAAGAIEIGSALTGATAATVGEGVALGLTQAGNLLLSGLGAAILAIGGTLGAVSDVRKHHNRISAEMARIESAEYARRREANLEHEVEVVQEMAKKQQMEQRPIMSANTRKAMGMDTESDTGFTAREMQRREAETANPYRNMNI